MSGVWKQRISDEDNNIPGGRKLGPGPDIRLSELELDNMRTDNCELRLNIVMRMWGMLTLWHGDMRERVWCNWASNIRTSASADIFWHLHLVTDWIWVGHREPSQDIIYHFWTLHLTSFPIFKQDIVFSQTFDLWIKTSHITSYTLVTRQDMTKG